MSKYLGKPERSARGFQFIEFQDIYGAKCSIQKSSLADTEAIWLGCDHETVHEVTGEKCGSRMHLDKKLAKQVVATLQKWIETGRL